MNGIRIVGNAVVDSSAATVGVGAIIIRHRLPFPLCRQPPTVVTGKRCGPVPTDIRDRMILKTGINGKRAACPVDPGCSTVSGAVIGIARTGKVVIVLSCKVGS